MPSATKLKSRVNPKQTAIAGANKVRRETFDGLPIVDAKDNFTLVVRTDDLKAAKGHQKDFSNCILAKACWRQVGANTVLFLRSVVYLELPNSKGEKQVVRYMLDRTASSIVRAFDRGRSVKGEVTVTLKAPKKSQQLDTVREKSRQRVKKKREAILMGQIIEPNAKLRRFAKPARIKDMDVRNGTGLIRNIPKKH